RADAFQRRIPSAVVWLLGFLHLEREVDGGVALDQRAGRDDVDARKRELGHVVRGDAAGHLQHESRELRLQLVHHRRQCCTDLGLEVVEHDNIAAGAGSQLRFLHAPAFDLDLPGEASHLPSDLDGLQERTERMPRADRREVVVLEHDHGGRVVAVRVGAAHEQRVLLDQAKARRRLAGAGQDAVPVDAVQQLAHAPRRGGHAAGPRQAVEDHALGQEHAPRLALSLPHLGDRAEPLALIAQPLDVAVELRQDGVGERHPGQDAGALAPQVGGAVRLAYDQEAHVQTGLVLAQPVAGQPVQNRRVQQGLHGGQHLGRRV
ncbi:unnamed protein product, partial [Ixodes hexagonus]